MDKRFILAQGSMDGACFLYSVANAVKALRPRKLQPQHWSEMLQGIKRVGDFMDQQVGTENCDQRPSRQVAVLQRMMRALSPTQSLEASWAGDDLTGKQLTELITAEAVIVVGTREHWVCAVDVDYKARHLLIADSSKLHLTDIYSEERGTQFARIFNNRWSGAPQKKYNRAFLISAVAR